MASFPEANTWINPYGHRCEILPVARALEAAVITGDEGGRAWQDRMDDL
jgi:hypothetical protein